MQLRHLNLEMILNGNPIRLNWAHKVTEDIYQIGYSYVNDPNLGGIWFMRALTTGGFEPVVNACERSQMADMLNGLVKYGEE